MIADEIELPMSNDATWGYGSFTGSLGHGLVLTSWVNGGSTQGAVIDVLTGQATLIAGLRGLLRDVTLSSDEQRAWVLCTYALHELDVASLKITRSAGTGEVGKYNATVLAIGDDLLLIGQKYARRSTLVSRHSMTRVRRVNTPTADLALPVDHGYLACSFTEQTARVLDSAGKWVGNAIDLPPGGSPVVAGQQVAYLTGVREAIPVAARSGLDPQRYAKLAPDGGISIWNPVRNDARVAASGTPVRALHTALADGRLVGSNRTDEVTGRTLYVLGPGGSDIVEHPLGAAVIDVVEPIPGTLVASHAGRTRHLSRVVLAGSTAG